MAAAIDTYSSSNSPVFSDPFSEELMKALEPFMKSASSSSSSSSSSLSPPPLSPPSTSYSPSLSPYYSVSSLPTMNPAFSQTGLDPIGSIGLNQLTPSQILQIQAQIHLQQQQNQYLASLQTQTRSQFYQNQNKKQESFVSSIFLRLKPIPMKQSRSQAWKPSKLYRGVRQRLWGKWVAEIRLQAALACAMVVVGSGREEGGGVGGERERDERRDSGGVGKRWR